MWHSVISTIRLLPASLKPINTRPRPSAHAGWLGGGIVAVSAVVGSDDHSVELELVSPDGDQGFPGELTARVRYTVGPDKVTIEELGAVAVPVRVARGAREAGAPPARVAELAAAALPRGELVTLAHLSHFGPFEDPDTVAEDACAFLAGHLS